MVKIHSLAGVFVRIGHNKVARKMDEEYLLGRITVHFGADIVSLGHEVHGRASYMDLVEGDHIEVNDGDQYQLITITDILDTIIERDSDRDRVWNRGESIYEGVQVRVRLDSQGNKQAALTEKSLKINKVMHALKQGFITHEEATQEFLKLELKDDE